MKFKIRNYTIDLDDPKNEAIREAKDKADNIAEWGKMFHKASLIVIIGSIFVALFGSFEAWLLAMLYWFILFNIAGFIMARAKKILHTAINKEIENDRSL